MFGLFTQKPKAGEEVQLKISGMHCTSCALTIDDEIEEIDGVFSSSTKYANSVTTIHYDPQKVHKKEFEKVIQKLGYIIV